MRIALTISVALALTACRGDQPDNDAAPADAAPAATTETLDVGTLSGLLDEGNIRLIDVRTDEEVAEGMIPGAEHIALDSFDPAQLDLSDGLEVVLYCRSGRRSAIAAERLAAFTAKPAKHLEGGILAWEGAGLPLSQQ